MKMHCRFFHWFSLALKSSNWLSFLKFWPVPHYNSPSRYWLNYCKFIVQKRGNSCPVWCVNYRFIFPCCHKAYPPFLLSHVQPIPAVLGSRGPCIEHLNPSHDRSSRPDHNEMGAMVAPRSHTLFQDPVSLGKSMLRSTLVNIDFCVSWSWLGKISRCLIPTKHDKAQTMSIICGMYSGAARNNWELLWRMSRPR